MKQFLLGGLKAFGRILGVTSVQQSEELLHSEAGARSLLSRRGFMGASAALAVTAVTYSMPRRRTWLGTPGYHYMSLHTADPGLFQAEEASYASYARVAISRTAEQWQVDQGVVQNKLPIVFPAATGGSTTISHISYLDERGRALLTTALSRPIHVGPGASPVFAAGDLRIDGADITGDTSLESADHINCTPVFGDTSKDLALEDDDWARSYHEPYLDCEDYE